MEIETLDWDSEFFGFRIGLVKLTMDEDLKISSFHRAVKYYDFKLVYVIKEGKVISFEELSTSQLNLVDIQITMQRKINPEEYNNAEYNLKKELTPQELLDCYYITEETSKVSRFNNDKNFNSMIIKDLYRLWIDNALEGTFSDGIFIEKKNSKIIGIHLIKSDIVNKVGHFSLTGVNPQYKRVGIGKNLWNQSFAYWVKEYDITTIQSKFSLQNIESMNFHLKMGFDRIMEIKYIYHFWN